MKPVTTFEYGVLHFDKNIQLPEKDRIPSRYHDRLEKLNKKNDAKYYTIYSDRIKFKQYVGLLQVGDLSIEVLPKIDKDDDKTKWRHVLIDMLRMCSKIKIDSMSFANQKLENSSLFEIFIRNFLEEVKMLIREGLNKKYRKTDDNINFYRGKLLVNNQIKYNHLHKERFYCEFNTFDYDNKMNQIIKRALDILLKMNISASLQDTLKSIILDLPEISSKKITKSDFDNLVFDRAGEKYKEAISLAKLIILNYQPDGTGQENTLAIFFNMNELFEEYIFRILRRYTDLNPKFKEPRRFCEFNELDKRGIRSDIYIESRNTVIDTKWKLLKNDSVKEIASSDLMQMYTYSKFFNCNRSILLYPDENETKNLYKGEFQDGSEINCQISKVTIIKVNDKKLKSQEIAINIKTCILKEK